MATSRFIEISTKIDKLKCCVIVPTYNNDKTLKKVLEELLQYTSNILVVNDGSTDRTSKILSEFDGFIQIHFLKNKGKGEALKAGFKRALDEGYEYGITIDSDGQHYADDLPVFLEALEQCSQCMLIGSRNMKNEEVPKSSSFGNRFSNFWFWVDTGISLSDTQSGYRAYPLKELSKITLYTSRFEFEIESIVRLAWREIDVRNVPIKVYYSEDRVSHFRPIKDFGRISLLNTWLFLVAIFYIRPLYFIKRIKGKGIKRFFLENVIQSQDSPIRKSLSIALGVFIGIAPFWGFQTILVFALAIPLKLNKVIAFTFSNISIPPMIPFIIYGSLLMGGWILGTDTKIDFKDLSSNIKLLGDLKEYIVGSFALATVSAVFFGLLGYIVLKLMGKR